MDILIKRNDYEKFMEFLIKNQDESEWKIFLENIKANTNFLTFTKEYMVSLKSITVLRKFLFKIFSIKSSEISQQVVIYEIIDYIRNSDSQFAKNVLVKNLYLIQSLRLSVLDVSYKEKLVEIIKGDMKIDSWFINLLENFAFYEELAYLYELMEDYKTSLKFYKMSQNISKIEEINSKLTPITNDESIPNMLL